MAEDELVGNIATETIIQYFSEKNLLPDLNLEAFAKAEQIAAEIFQPY